MVPIKSNTFSYAGECLILPGNGANVGLVIYYDGQFEAYQRTYVLEKISNLIIFKYLFYVMNLNWKSYNDDKLFGSAIPYIKLGNLLEYPFPLPPLAEQQRIVSKIEELFELFDKIQSNIS